VKPTKRRPTRPKPVDTNSAVDRGD
jgi:hypothetical protein